MKIARARIQGFRYIKDLELDFTDELGNVRDITVIVAPNGEGKTSALLALESALGTVSQLFLRPRRIGRGDVHHTRLSARVDCEVRFSGDEVAAAQQLWELAGKHAYVPQVEVVQLHWEYPDPAGKHEWGVAECDPAPAWRLFQGRVTALRMSQGTRIDLTWLHRCGVFFLFDQSRSGARVRIPREAWEAMFPLTDQDRPSDAGDPDRYATDPGVILKSLGVQAQFRPASDQVEASPFDRVRAGFDLLCAPHRLLGVVRGRDEGLDVQFFDGKNTYEYDGLSSGQQMLLRYLIVHETSRLHRSVVCVDEVELHLHPAWQVRTLLAFPRMGEDNQIIATTHSEYIRDAMPPSQVIDIGAHGLVD